MKYLGGCLFVALMLNACGSTPSSSYSALESHRDFPKGGVNSVLEPMPRVEPKSRYGNPASYEVFGKQYYTLEDGKDYQEEGLASWYGPQFHGKRTSSGEPYDMFQMTAAHKSLPLPSYVKVRNLDNGKEIIVKVNDRGPFKDGRIIDLSYTAASKLGAIAKGVIPVEVIALATPMAAE